MGILFEELPPPNEGERFGRWTTTGEIVYKHGRLHVACLCDCGTKRVICASRLRTGKTASCGCSRRAVPDMSGKRFGRLTVLRYAEQQTKKDEVLWVCVCTCGQKICATGSNLRSGRTRSCGCLQKQAAKTLRRTHGLSDTPEYEAWVAMIQRCRNPRNPSFRNYGGRGIVVASEWLSFEAFIRDMGARPSAKHTLERVDNNGSYCASNCAWVLRPDQARNKRSNRVIEFGGETRILIDWAKHLGIHPNTLRKRLAKWPIERALTLRKVS